MKTIYELDLHEVTIINNKVRAIRVPGGWIYERVTKRLSVTDNEIVAVFVPYSDEYAPV